MSSESERIAVLQKQLSVLHLMTNLLYNLPGVELEDVDLSGIEEVSLGQGYVEEIQIQRIVDNVNQTLIYKDNLQKLIIKEEDKPESDQEVKAELSKINKRRRLNHGSDEPQASTSRYNPEPFAFIERVADDHEREELLKKLPPQVVKDAVEYFNNTSMKKLFEQSPDELIKAASKEELNLIELVNAKKLNLVTLIKHLDYRASLKKNQDQPKKRRGGKQKNKKIINDDDHLNEGQGEKENGDIKSNVLQPLQIDVEPNKMQEDKKIRGENRNVLLQSPKIDDQPINQEESESSDEKELISNEGEQLNESFGENDSPVTPKLPISKLNQKLIKTMEKVEMMEQNLLKKIRKRTPGSELLTIKNFNVESYMERATNKTRFEELFGSDSEDEKAIKKEKTKKEKDSDKNISKEKKPKLVSVGTQKSFEDKPIKTKNKSCQTTFGDKKGKKVSETDLRAFANKYRQKEGVKKDKEEPARAKRSKDHHIPSCPHSVAHQTDLLVDSFKRLLKISKKPATTHSSSSNRFKTSYCYADPEASSSKVAPTARKPPSDNTDPQASAAEKDPPKKETKKPEKSARDRKNKKQDKTDPKKKRE